VRERRPKASVTNALLESTLLMHSVHERMLGHMEDNISRRWIEPHHFLGFVGHELSVHFTWKHVPVEQDP